MKTTQAEIITIKDLRTWHQSLPESLVRAAGLLKNRKINALRYQRQMRKEWEQRFKQLTKQYGAR